MIPYAESLLLLLIIALATFSFLMERFRILGPLAARKVLHIGAIALSAFCPVLVSDLELTRWIVAIFIPLTYVAVSRGFLKAPGTNRPSWGIFYFVLVYFLLLLFFDTRPSLIYYPMMILAFADGFAAIAGSLLPIRIDERGNNMKTITGTASFIITAILVFSFPYHPIDIRLNLGWPEIIYLSFFLGFVEFLALNGRDNIWVPLAVVYWLSLGVVPYDGMYGFALCVPFLGSLAVRLKWLRPDGAIAATILGWLLLISPFPLSIIPALEFFLIGTALSKLPKPLMPKQESIRNAEQVLSNGIVPVLGMCLYFISGLEFWFLAALAAFSTALSDTASSEIGSRYGRSTIDLIRGEKVEPGISGAISVHGTLAGILMAILLPLIASFWIPLSFMQISLIAIVGFAGNIFDSLYGSTLQIRYFDSRKNQWSDIHSGTYEKSRGFSFITNDRVNFLSSLSSFLLASLLFYNI